MKKNFIKGIMLLVILLPFTPFSKSVIIANDRLQLFQNDTSNAPEKNHKIVFSVGAGVPGTALWFAPDNTLQFFEKTIYTPNIYDQKKEYGKNIPLFGKLILQLHPHNEFGIHFHYSKYNCEDIRYFYESESYSFLMRFNWHRDIKKIVDVYWGIGLGYRYGDVYSIDKQKNILQKSTRVNYLSLEYTTGARFNIYENAGIYIEFGLTRAIFQGGLFYHIPY